MGNLGNILNKLHKVKTLSDKSYMACCPAHEDKEPSLHITVEGDRILLKCFSGCTPESIVNAIGLNMQDLFLDPYEPKMPPFPTGTIKKIVATYDYKDEQGNLLYQVVRYEPKDFRQRRKNDKGEWDWNLNGVKRVLYHLNDIVNVQDETIYLVEGEKDADNLWSWGRIATTSPGGAGAWKDEYADYLAGKKVVIIPDRDEPGLKYAIKAALSLSGKASSLSVVLLSGENIKDISNWLEYNNDISMLCQLEEPIDQLLKLKSVLFTSEEVENTTPVTSEMVEECEKVEKSGILLKKVEISTDENRGKIIWKEVDNWLILHRGESFDLNVICSQLDIKNKDDRNCVAKKLWFEVKRETLEKSNRLYSYIDRTYKSIDWVHAKLTPPMMITWPHGIDDGSRFGFDGAAHVSPGDIIIIAGLSNMGKSLFCINFLWENMDNYPGSVLMGNEYTPSKFARRVSKMDWKNPCKEDGTPKFELIERRENWKAIIKPNAINIIDWINLEDNFYKIGSIIEGIQSKLKDGIALIAIQKDANKNLGLGGGFSEHLASLYLTIDKNRLTCRKCKEWSGHNPNGEMYSFEIHNEGTEFRNIHTVVQCKVCFGTGKKQGGECSACMGTGVVKKF